MLLPYRENAVVDIRKLRDYCLNPHHSDGKHKARLLRLFLGLTADDAEDLRVLLLEAVMIHDARPLRQDLFGQRYAVDFELEWRGRRAWVRSGWILKAGSEVPRLTTCYIL